MNTKQFNQLMTQVSKFNTLEMAKAAAENAAKLSDIILGDDGKFWVTRFQIAIKLVNAGYQYAE